ncbi:MAG: DUF3501 family protein [Ectothiorhodospiraceae bacterium]|nr:DUF3501 family protein [Ectothiorhodospiraceae bacterium]
MRPLTRDDLMGLEQYAEARPEFRARVLAHKRLRRIQIGPHATLHFEDRLTIQYQVQEMLRTERIFEKAGIEEELEAYNPLIPDGTNLKATLMIEYEDVEERREALARLRGVEDRVWVEVDGHSRAYAIADEDLERENEEKTSSVHFMRFELEPAARAAALAGAAIRIGIDHDAYRHSVTLTEASARNLAADLEAAA